MAGQYIAQKKTGNARGRTVLGSFTRTELAALMGGAAAWGGIEITSNVWVQFVLGGISGLLVYGAGLWVLQSPEIHEAWNTFRKREKTKPLSSPVALD